MSDATGIEGYFAAWSGGDADAIMAWLTEDVVIEDVPSGHVARGAAEAREFVDGALKKAPGAQYEIVSSQTGADSFAVEWVMQPAGVRGASVGSLRDGRISANRDYWNAGALPV
jgi:ketosteroid isomerase-like protein